MSGPHSDQPTRLEPHEAEQQLAIYWAHQRPLGETCSCGKDACSEGAKARLRLWMAGINPTAAGGS